jgi:transposase InsO family protein
VAVVTLFFHTMHVYVIVPLESRRIVPCAVTDHPTAAWVAQRLRKAIPINQKPKYVVCDHDRQYGAEFERVAQTTGIEVFHTPYQAPLANAICERFIGSLRRVCLDYVLVLSVRQPLRILTEYVRYFNQSRPHQGIAQRIPESVAFPRTVASTEKVAPFSAIPAATVKRTTGKVIAFPVLNGPHHDYRWAA